MKKQLSISLILMFLCTYINAQEAIGINTSTPDASSILDVVSTDKGVLIPRMTATQRTAISSPANGLLVYETTTNTFWFHNGTSWIQLVSSTSTDEIADADGDTRIQVEESVDDDIIRFDLAGTEYFRMNSGRLEFVNTGRSIFIGQNAGSSDDFSNNDGVFIGHNSGRNNTTGSRNVSVGFRSFNRNTTGSDNIAIGEDALRLNQTGNANIAIGSNALDRSVGIDSNLAFGFNALTNLTSGNNNIAVGTGAMTARTGGSYNVGIGNEALENNLTGDQNVAVGRQAGENSTGSGNVFIGYRAGRAETGNDKLYIEPSASTTPLIWGDFSTDSLVINGDQHVTGNITYVGTLTDVSDRRLKENFDSLNRVIALLGKLQAYSYNMKGDEKSIKEYGLIAQEVQKVFPEIVKEIDQEGHIGVSYIQLVPILIEAIKELQVIINSQGNSLTLSQDRLNLLKAEVEQIKVSIKQ